MVWGDVAQRQRGRLRKQSRKSGWGRDFGKAFFLPEGGFPAFLLILASNAKESKAKNGPAPLTQGT